MSSLGMLLCPLLQPFRSLAGQSKPEAAAFRQLAFDPNSAPMRLYEPLADRQPETAPAFARGICSLDLLESIKYILLQIRWNTSTFVLYRQLGIFRSRFYRHPYLSLL